jgi:serine O-acetyltransferase
MGMLDTLHQDIKAVFERDPAARTTLEVLLFYPGLHALWLHRLAHFFWSKRLFLIGRGLSYVNRWLTGIDIHPAAKIGPGFFIDHGMGTVIGETSEIGANVTMYHDVTLGGVSWEKVKRHPTIEDCVVIGAGAQILGPIRIGKNSRIGANSVVVKDIPEHSVVVGVPGRVQSLNGMPIPQPGLADLRHDRLPDPTMELLQKLNERVEILEDSMGDLHLEDDRKTADAWVAEVVEEGSHI